MSEMRYDADSSAGARPGSSARGRFMDGGVADMFLDSLESLGAGLPMLDDPAGNIAQQLQNTMPRLWNFDVPCPDDDKVAAMVLGSTDNFLESMLDALTSNPDLQLQVTTAGGTPIATEQKPAAAVPQQSAVAAQAGVVPFHFLPHVQRQNSLLVQAVKEALPPPAAQLAAEQQKQRQQQVGWQQQGCAPQQQATSSAGLLCASSAYGGASPSLSQTGPSECLSGVPPAVRAPSQQLATGGIATAASAVVPAAVAAQHQQQQAQMVSEAASCGNNSSTFTDAWALAGQQVAAELLCSQPGAPFTLRWSPTKQQQRQRQSGAACAPVASGGPTAGVQLPLLPLHNISLQQQQATEAAAKGRSPLLDAAAADRAFASAAAAPTAPASRLGAATPFSDLASLSGTGVTQGAQTHAAAMAAAAAVTADARGQPMPHAVSASAGSCSLAAAAAGGGLPARPPSGADPSVVSAGYDNAPNLYTWLTPPFDPAVGRTLPSPAAVVAAYAAATSRNGGLQRQDPAAETAWAQMFENANCLRVISAPTAQQHVAPPSWDAGMGARHSAGGGATAGIGDSSVPAAAEPSATHSIPRQRSNDSQSLHSHADSMSVSVDPAIWTASAATGAGVPAGAPPPPLERAMIGGGATNAAAMGPAWGAPAGGRLPGGLQRGELVTPFTTMAAVQRGSRSSSQVEVGAPRLGEAAVAAAVMLRMQLRSDDASASAPMLSYGPTAVPYLNWHGATGLSMSTNPDTAAEAQRGARSEPLHVLFAANTTAAGSAAAGGAQQVSAVRLLRPPAVGAAATGGFSMGADGAGNRLPAAPQPPRHRLSATGGSAVPAAVEGPRATLAPRSSSGPRLSTTLEPNAAEAPPGALSAAGAGAKGGGGAAAGPGGEAASAAGAAHTGGHENMEEDRKPSIELLRASKPAKQPTARCSKEPPRADARALITDGSGSAAKGGITVKTEAIDAEPVGPERGRGAACTNSGGRRGTDTTKARPASRVRAAARTAVGWGEAPGAGAAAGAGGPSGGDSDGNNDGEESQRQPKGRRHGTQITRAYLQEHFDKPIKQVARQLGSSLSFLKKVCRTLGVPRWPCRKLTCLARMCQSLMADPANAATNQRLLDLAQQNIEEIRANPDAPMYPVFAKLRQSQYKATAQRNRDGGEGGGGAGGGGRQGVRPLRRKDHEDEDETEDSSPASADESDGGD